MRGKRISFNGVLHIMLEQRRGRRRWKEEEKSQQKAERVLHGEEWIDEQDQTTQERKMY